MFDDISDLYQQVILDHSKSPRNFRPLEEPSHQARGRNPLCGDNVTLFLRTDGDVIRDIAFQGSGCAISKASASLLTETLKGRSVAEVKPMFDQVRNLVTTGETGAATPEKLEVFSGVHKFPARVKCAILPWHAVMAALEGNGEPVTTE